MSIKEEFRDAREKFKLLSLYQRFEHIIIIILTALISVIVVVAVWNLSLKILFGLILSGNLDPSDYAIFQGVFGMIFTVIIALEFRQTLLVISERRRSIVHVRAVRLSPDGRALDGEDSFIPPEGQAFTANAPDEYAIRFHLHAAIKASRLSDGRGVILLLPDKEVWTFATLAESVDIEESVYLAGTDGPRRTTQIVIYGHARSQQAVRWSFRHTPPAPAGARAERADEPELPL